MLALDDFVAKDSMARVIDAFVDTLDMEKLGFSYFKLSVKRGYSTETVNRVRSGEITLL